MMRNLSPLEMTYITQLKNMILSTDVLTLNPVKDFIQHHVNGIFVVGEQSRYFFFKRVMKQLRLVENAVINVLKEYGSNVQNAGLGIFWLTVIETAFLVQNVDRENVCNFVLSLVKGESIVFTLPNQKLAYWTAILLILDHCLEDKRDIYHALFRESRGQAAYPLQREAKNELKRSLPQEPWHQSNESETWKQWRQGIRKKKVQMKQRMRQQNQRVFSNVAAQQTQDVGLPLQSS